MMHDIPVILQEKATQDDYDCNVQIPPGSSDCLSLIVSVIGTRNWSSKGSSIFRVFQIWPD
jgi:hypothetical protein